jgi:CRP-like cAMP-binding protein
VAKSLPSIPLQPAPDLWKKLGELKSARSYAPGATILTCGDPIEGVYLVEQGDVKLLVSGPTKAAVLGKAGPGVVLGLSEALTGAPCKLTAEAMTQVGVAFVERDQFLNFLRSHHEFCMQIVRLLSEEVHVLYYRFRTLTHGEIKARGRTSSSKN